MESYLSPSSQFTAGTQELRKSDFPHSSTLSALFFIQTKCMYSVLKCSVFSNFLPLVYAILFTQIALPTKPHPWKSYLFTALLFSYLLQDTALFLNLLMNFPLNICFTFPSPKLHVGVSEFLIPDFHTIGFFFLVYLSYPLFKERF